MTLVLASISSILIVKFLEVHHSLRTAQCDLMHLMVLNHKTNDQTHKLSISKSLRFNGIQTSKQVCSVTENFILLKAKSTFVFSDFQVSPPIRINLLPLTQGEILLPTIHDSLNTPEMV